MHRGLFTASASVVVALALTTVQAQQTRQQPQSTFRGRTDLISVDVSVLDRDRQPVGGLTAADFTVLEDGKPRPVVAFSAVELPPVDRRETVAAWVRDAPLDVVANNQSDEGRLVVILMDGTIPNGQATVAARQIARAAVNELGPGDLAAVVRSSVFGNNGLSQGFTGDRSRLIEAIDSPSMGTTEAPDMAAGGLTSPSPVPGSLFQTQPQCEVIWNVARAMRDAPRRRKVLLFVGSRIGINNPLLLGPDLRPCREVMLHELAESNVTVQAVDPVGLLTTSISADHTTHEQISANLVNGWARQNQSRIDDMRILPELTGGRLVANTNTPEKFMPAIFGESQQYYLLGFEPASPAADGTFHTIGVQVRRRGATVHARSGYVAEPRAITRTPGPAIASVDAAAPAPELAAALDGALPRQDLPLSVNVASFALPVGKNAVVAVALGATLPSGAGPRRLDVTIGAFDLRGRSVAVRSQTLELSSELASTGEAQDGLVARLDLPPGRYELRAAVKDQTSGAVGSVFSFVDVPAFARGDTAVSGLVLHRNRALLIADNPLADVVPILPTVARTFSRDDKVSAFLRIYQPNEPQLVSVMTRVVDTTNRTVFEQRKELASEAFRARTADFDVPLPLSQLVPGNYLLKIEVTRGEWRAERDARFEISSKR